MVDRNYRLALANRYQQGLYEAVQATATPSE